MISVKLKWKIQISITHVFGQIVTFPLNFTVILMARGKLLITNCQGGKLQLYHS
jgi:hypothetical protein